MTLKLHYLYCGSTYFYPIDITKTFQADWLNTTLGTKYLYADYFMKVINQFPSLVCINLQLVDIIWTYLLDQVLWFNVWLIFVGRTLLLNGRFSWSINVAGRWHVGRYLSKLIKGTNDVKIIRFVWKENKKAGMS